jgi:hypothetical protein
MLTYRDRGRSGAVWDVLCGSVVIASIHKQMMGPGAQRLGIQHWDWTFNFNYKLEGFETHGHADSFDDVKAQVEKIGWCGSLPPV